MAEEITSETPEIQVEAPKDKKIQKGLVEVLEGDNYRTIAERLDGKVTAQDLFVLNGEVPLYPGMKVRIK